MLQVVQLQLCEQERAFSVRLYRGRNGKPGKLHRLGVSIEKRGDQMTKIHEKLLLVQCELKAPKSQYNSFGKYHYRNCEDVLEAVKPLLQKQGLLLTLSDDVVMVGSRYYVKAIARVTDGENEVSVTAMAREEESKKGMDGSQITGSSSSYARKYALNGLFDIDDTKDSDTPAPTPPEPEYCCVECGKLFKDTFVQKTGKQYTAKEIYTESMKKYGGLALCKNCGEKFLAEKV